MGGVLYPPSLEAIVERAVADGIIVMAAAGQFVGAVVWPARLPGCLGVGGSARGGEPWTWSSVGREVDVSAPAKDVWVAATRCDGADPFHVAQHDGTSFAVALTAGVAALWLAHHGRASIEQAVGGPGNVQAAFRALVRRTSTEPPGWDTERRGSGIVDARKLLEADPATWQDDPDPPSVPPTDPAGRVLDAVAAIAPDGVEPKQAQARILSLFDGAVDRLAQFGDELVYRLAEREDLRAALLAPAHAGLDAGADEHALLRAVASPSLRDALG